MCFLFAHRTMALSHQPGVNVIRRVLLIVLLGGGGWYGRGRWYGRRGL
jgi:hypothetical protein